MGAGYEVIDSHNDLYPAPTFGLLHYACMIFFFLKEMLV